MKRTELLDQLKKVMPGIDTSSNGIIGADAFTFTEEGIHTYNDLISVTVPYKSGIIGAVKSTKLFNLLAKMKADDIEITQGDELSIKGGRTKAKIKFIDSDVEEFLNNLSIDNLKWEPCPKDFLEGLALCKIAASNSPFRGIYVRGGKIFSTDEMRINVYDLSEKMSQFWIDDPAIAELLKIASDINELSVTDGWVHFRGESGVVFSCKKKADEEYPFKELLRRRKTTKVDDALMQGTFPKNFGEAVERVSVFSDTMDGFSIVHMDFTNTKLILKTQMEIGEVQEEIILPEPLGIKGTIQTAADASFLTEAADRSLEFFLSKTADGVESMSIFKDGFIQMLATIATDNIDVEISEEEEKPKKKKKAKKETSKKKDNVRELFDSIDEEGE